MSKINNKPKKLNTNNNKPDMEKIVMDKIKSEQIKMKPRLYFVAGSLFMIIGLIGLTAGAIFLTNLTIFLIRKKGPGYGRLEAMLDSFPWWIPALAVVGVILGGILLKKYDFSYRKNFSLIIIGFVISILAAAFMLNYLGLNDTWSHQGPMRKFYQQIENQDNFFPRNQGHGRVRSGNGN